MLRDWWRWCASHLVGFLLFLGLTIYTATHLPNIVEPNTLHRWHSGIMESLPSYLHLPEALSSCVPGTFYGTRCAQVRFKLHLSHPFLFYHR